MNDEKQKLKTRVVNIYKTREPYVYIGRGSRWGNPFVIGIDGDRDTVIKKFEEHLVSDSYMLKMARAELKGHTLGCFCKPLPCHGDVYVKYCEGDETT